MQPISLFLPPYVKKFLIRAYGREPIYVREDNDLGRIFSLAFGKDTGQPYESDFGELKATPNLQRVRFEITWNMNRLRLTESNYLRLGNALEEEVHKAVYHFCLGQVIRHMSITGSVRNFFEIYNILEQVDGISVEAARKRVSRRIDKRMGIVSE
jgi:hypothetical protein